MPHLHLPWTPSGTVTPPPHWQPVPAHHRMGLFSMPPLQRTLCLSVLQIIVTSQRPLTPVIHPDHRLHSSVFALHVLVYPLMLVNNRVVLKKGLVCLGNSIQHRACSANLGSCGNLCNHLIQPNKTQAREPSAGLLHALLMQFSQRPFSDPLICS